MNRPARKQAPTADALGGGPPPGPPRSGRRARRSQPLPHGDAGLPGGRRAGQELSRLRERQRHAGHGRAAERPAAVRGDRHDRLSGPGGGRGPGGRARTRHAGSAVLRPGGRARLYWRQTARPPGDLRAGDSRAGGFPGRGLAAQRDASGRGHAPLAGRLAAARRCHDRARPAAGRARRARSPGAGSDRRGNRRSGRHRRGHRVRGGSAGR